RQSISRTEQSFPWNPIIDARIQTLPDEPSLARIAVRVINQTPNKTTDFFDANLYEIQLRVWVPPSAYRASLFRELPQSYRYNTTLPAVGINSHIDCAEEQGYIRFTTTTVPVKETARIVPRDLQGTVPTFAGLAREPIPLLQRIASEMRRYHDTVWQEKVGLLQGDSKQEAEGDQRDFLNNEVLRFERGIDILSRYETVMQAFRFMNETMGKVARWDAWYLFQIVFIVSQIPSLAARHYKELHSLDDDYVDILWFPAGGGKTEAFLGLIVWEAFFDRIRGKLLGVTAIVRFPLRLLTFQQLQRVSITLAAADQIREREHLGGQRFSLGYMVGSDTTPNTINGDLDNALAQANEDWLNERYRRLIRCPFCKEKTVSMSYDRQCRRLEHRCTAKSCPNQGKSIPLYIVDDDVYFLLTTIVVSTEDKLA
ncbi:MAG: hypothetical protein MN733_31780, partial [Nitrososphaera sp.]|nr:hypothetical protein [Nitrososphaera sp.]